MKGMMSSAQWKREIIRIVYKINQYFYPQGQTQNLNEGFASFTHYYIMTRLEEKGILSSDAFIAFLDSHAGVLYQPEYNKRWYSGINPYALGFNILMDVKRICEKPTEEDRDWFPHLIGKRWQDAIKEAVFEHRDDSFIMQYLSPNVIRKMGLFSVNVTEDLENFEGQKAVVSDIHDEAGYKQIRINLARSYERINRVPQIAVTGADLEGDRTLYLEYIPYMGRKLDRETAESVADYIDFLWGYPVELDDGEPDED
jgi:spore cortex formation protein SpoVR/YcgB (stage V sporulation)